MNKATIEKLKKRVKEKRKRYETLKAANEKLLKVMQEEEAKELKELWSIEERLSDAEKLWAKQV